MSSLYSKEKKREEVSKLYGHVIVSDNVVREYVARVQKGTFISEMYSGAPILTVRN